ncbi:MULTISPECIES: ComEC/Rec2 family competence protein [Lactobacillaceae]|uniref:MBL fold metallo-hydrolase n=1 Tax=Loigolactobacillus binensis TaxID=2559922 RepID=A0ABW3EH82_9LACO|nr:hypothetical protein [Loigolactobacillus binensis]
MSIVKFFNVSNGDMSYIEHNSDNFSIIDCNLPEDSSCRTTILNEIQDIRSKKSIFRFISTHPDEDHFHGLEDISNIENFYCVKNSVTKQDITPSFKAYSNLRDDENRAFYIEKDCSRKWMNQGSNERGSSGIMILWPDTSNEDFQSALDQADASPNNISPIIKYSIEDNATFLWMGDLETKFMQKIEDNVVWPKIDVLLAPHHGRKSGHVPGAILEKLKPKLIILGHAESKDMNYYCGWNTILKKHSGNITIECSNHFMNIWVENPDYTSKIKTLKDNPQKTDLSSSLYYIGSISVD